MERRLLLLTAVLAVMFGPGCGRRETVDSGMPVPAPLARVGDIAITEDDFNFEVQRRRATGRPIGDKETMLRELMEREAMLAKARQSELFDDPLVRRELENQILSRWLEAALQSELDRVVVTDEDLKRRYEAEIERFTIPRRVRLALLFRRADSSIVPDDPDSSRAALERARGAYLADPEGATQKGRIPGFGTVAAESSEDAVSRYRGGDLGWMEITRAAGRLPEEVAEIGFGLDVGRVSDVIAAGEGFYVVMKSDERPAETIPFEEALTRLRRHVIREKQDAVRESFMQSLMEGAQTEINREKLAALDLPPPEKLPEKPDLKPAEDFFPRQ